MISLVNLVNYVLELYLWCIIIFVILSWLVTFGVINTHNRFVYMVSDFLYRITEPALGPIRRIMPSFGGIDISPIVLILLIWFLQSLLREYAYPAVAGM